MVSADGHLYKSISREVWCIYCSFKAYTHFIHGTILLQYYTKQVLGYIAKHISHLIYKCRNIAPIHVKTVENIRCNAAHFPHICTYLLVCMILIYTFDDFICEHHTMKCIWYTCIIHDSFIGTVCCNCTAF